MSNHTSEKRRFMVRESEHLCPLCGGELKYLGHVRRIMKTGSGHSKWIEVDV